VASLVEEYKAGATVYELAERFKITRQTASKHLHRQDVLMRRQGLDAQQIDEAAKLYGQDWSVARIGGQLGFNGGTVWRALRASDVPMRDTHGRERLGR